MNDPSIPDDESRSPAAEGSAKPTLATLRQHTPARIALDRSGSSLSTAELLAFDLDHARARDAVHASLDVAALRAALEADGWPVREVRSAAADRVAYLARPDWGRQLHAESATALAGSRNESAPTLCIVAADGLSAIAVQRHVVPLLHRLRELLSPDCTVAPVVIATQARVALADEIGETVGAALALCLIGERPGLSSPDSLGAYLTWAPRVGRSDAERNCISNIRPAGLPYEIAAQQIAALVKAMLAARLSGVALRFDPAKLLT